MQRLASSRVSTTTRTATSKTQIGALTILKAPEEAAVLTPSICVTNGPSVHLPSHAGSSTCTRSPLSKLKRPTTAPLRAATNRIQVTTTPLPPARSSRRTEPVKGEARLPKLKVRCSRGLRDLGRSDKPYLGGHRLGKQTLGTLRQVP